jgi:hypothetical protein
VDDREQRHGPSSRCRLLSRGRLERLELASGRAVDDLPSSRVELLPEGVGGGEVTLQPALRALGEQSLGLVAV